MKHEQPVNYRPATQRFKAMSFEILIIDDDDEVLLRLEQLLEREGYQTTTTWCPREAFELLQTRQFDLILLDDHLAGADWQCVLQRLRLVSGNTPCIVLHPAPQGADDRGNICGTEVRGLVCKWAADEVLEAVKWCAAAVPRHPGKDRS